MMMCKSFSTVTFVEALAASWIEMFVRKLETKDKYGEALAASWIEIPVMPYVRVCI